MRFARHLAFILLYSFTAFSPAAAQGRALDGEWVAVQGDFFGEPIPDATMPLLRIEFDRSEGRWSIMPGYPRRFTYQAYGEGGVDSLDFTFAIEGPRSWSIPVRSARNGDTLVLAFANAEPFDPERSPPPARPGPEALTDPGPYMRLELVPAGVRRPESRLTPVEAEAARALSGTAIERKTRALTAPELEGRESGRPGGERAARMIADWFEEAGLEPLGEDGFLQRVPLFYGRASDSSSLTVGDTTFYVGDDFAVSGLPVRSRPQRDVAVSGEVFLFGPSFGPAPANAPLPDLDVEGKIVAWLALSGPDPEPMRTYEALDQAGAAAVILILGPGPLPAPLLQSPLFAPVVALDADLNGSGPARPVLLLGQGPFAALFGDGSDLRSFMAELQSGDPVLRATGKQVSISYRLEESTSAPTFNVVGVLQGTDPTLRGEAVVYTAHYDAFGVHDGRLHPGAADNALGVAEMVEIADAFRSTGTRPRRSIVFLATGAEERGMLGSLYWVRNPTWPIDGVVAQLNMDGGDAEAWGPLNGVIDLTRQATLADIAAETGAAMGLPILPNDSRGFQGSSDFYDFLRACIPAIQLMGIGGDPTLSPDRMDRFGQRVHQPGDVIDEGWDWAGPEQMARVYLLLGLRVANGDERPGFRRGSPFATCEQ